jgi:hypothetical protein
MNIDLRQAWKRPTPDFSPKHFWENPAQIHAWPPLAPLPPQESFWAACHFHMPPNDFCAAWWLEGSGIQGRYRIWLNGQEVAQNLGGEFRVDVTPTVCLDDNWLLAAFEHEREGQALLDWPPSLSLQAYPCETEGA